MSFPDDNGIVQVSAAGLPPGTSVLLVNAGNGIVLSLTVDNDGNLTGELPASISDRILITLTDPAGSSVSLEKSKFVAPDGTTGIGPGGGTVEGPGGVELRIPEGALEQGVTLQIESFDENFLPQGQKPDLPNSNFGAGLKITSEDVPTFEKEVKLAFPKPDDAPDGAFFYVYRQLETDTGIVQWETIDHAFIEGDKVVTASFPFAGFISAVAVTTLFVLVWTHDASAPNLASTGTVTGKVLRTVFQPASTAPSFVPIPGVVVQAVSGFGSHNGTVAISQKDGTYTLFDETFRDGNVEVQATVDDVTQTSTAYAINVGNVGDSQLRFYPNVATANLTFPPQAPAPRPPAIDVVILKRNPDNTKERTDGLVVEDDELTIGFVTQDFIQRASINGETFAVRRDDADARFDWVLEQAFTPGRAGTFLIEVTALSPEGSVVEQAVTFRAIAAGGSNNDVLNGEPPSVITLKTVPKNEAKGVPVSIFAQITFTEPVTNIPGNVTLVDSRGEEVGLTLSGVGPDGPIAAIESTGAKVTSLTLIPMTGLKFGERYTLDLTSGIEDLDTDPDNNPAPKSLVPFTTSFTTFGPEALGGTEDKFGSAGIAVLGDRAYLVENKFYFGTLRVFDVTDPVEPVEIPEAQAEVTGRPVDIVGEDQLIAIATSTTNKSRPSNLYFFDVSSDAESRWVGAASVASSATDGFAIRIRLLDGVAYALTGRKGIQVIDVNQATDLFQASAGAPFSPEYFSVVRRLNTDGQGFGQQAVGQAIPLPKDASRDFFQQDLAAARIQTEIWTATTGEAPLFLVNPVSRATTGSVPVETIGDPASIMTSGASIEMGQVGGRDVALIAGWGSVGGEPPGWAFAVVDVSTPSTPVTLDIISLPLDTAPTDILLTGNTAIVASANQAALVNVANPDKPIFAGTIDTVGGVLALTDANILVSSARSAFGGDTEQGGANTAVLGETAVITNVTASGVIITDSQLETEKDIKVHFKVVPSGIDVNSASVTISRDGQPFQTLTTKLDGSTGVATFSSRTPVDPQLLYGATAILHTDNANDLTSASKSLPLVHLDLDVDSNNNNVLDRPERTDAEDEIEDIVGKVQEPGKVIFANTSDTDGDKIPNFADGIDRFDQMEPDASGSFVPLILELPPGLDLGRTTVKFQYSASDPSKISKVGASDDPDFVPAPGNLRLWTKDGPEPRRATSVTSGGDFVPHDTDLRIQDLGTPVAGRTWQLYLEAVAASKATADQRIKATVSFEETTDNRTTAEDAVRSTVLEFALVRPDKDNKLTPAKEIKYSHPSPFIDVVSASIEDLHLGADKVQILGDIRLSGTITCSVCDYTPGANGTIDFVEVQLNDREEPLAVVPVSGSKANDQNSLLKPFEFTGSFSTVLTDVVVALGTNTIRIGATDKLFAITGYVELGIDVTAIAPDPVRTDYRVDMDFSTATSLGEIDADTPILFEVEDRLTGGVPLQTTLFKTSDGPLTFASDLATVVIVDDGELNSAFSPSERGRALAQVLVPSVASVPFAFELSETESASGRFVRDLVELQINFITQLTPNVIDSIEATITNAEGVTETVTLVETESLASLVFADATEDVVVRVEQRSLPGLPLGLIDTTLTNSRLEIQAAELTLVESESESNRFESTRNRPGKSSFRRRHRGRRRASRATVAAWPPARADRYDTH